MKADKPLKQFRGSTEKEARETRSKKNKEQVSQGLITSIPTSPQSLVRSLYVLNQ